MNILLVQTGFLGDNILSTPVITNLKRLHRNHKIIVLTTKQAAPIYEGNPDVNQIIIFDKQKSVSGLTGLFKMAKTLKDLNIEIAYSLHKSWRTAILLFLSKIPTRIGFSDARASFLYTERRPRSKIGHSVEKNLQILASEIELSQMNKELILYPARPEELAEDIANLNLTNNKFAVLVPGSVWKTKRWHTAGYRAVAESMLSKGYTVMLLGAPSEVEIAKQVSNTLPVLDLVGKTSLKEMFYLISKAAVVVCNDSMSLHVASSFKVPTVAIFCATSPQFGFGPWQNKRAIVVEKEGLHCKPCRRHGSNRCPTGTQACMQDLSSDLVLNAIDRVTMSM